MLKSLFHWKVLVNIIVAAVVFFGLVWLTFRWLEYHTKHGEETPVPNVMNISVQKAIKQLEDAGLTYEVDSGNYDPKFRPFQVLGVYPNPGARVKDGRIITLKVNPRTYAPVQVPDILDTYKGLAFIRLEQVGLKVGDTIYLIDEIHTPDSSRYFYADGYYCSNCNGFDVMGISMAQIIWGVKTL